MSSIIFIPLLTFALCSYLYFEDEYNVQHFHLFSFICLIIFSFLIGVRVNFGNDQVTYLYCYVNQKLENFELLYSKINEALYSYRAPYQILFILVSAIEFFLLLQVIKVNRTSYLWTVYFFFILTYFSFSVNGLRQAISIFFVLLSFYYFFCKKYINWLILILLAIGFHKSSIIFVLLCPFCKVASGHKKKSTTFFYLIPLFIIFIFYNQMWDIILNVLMKMSGVLPKEFQLIITSFSVWKIDLGSGIGVKLQLLGYMCVLPKFIQLANKNKYKSFLFSLFYIGLIGKYYSGQNMNLARLFYGCTITELILFSESIQTINKKNILSIKNLFFIFGCFVFFGLYVINSAKGVNSESPTPYIWDLDFSFKKHFGN